MRTKVRNLTLTATDVYSGRINLCALLNKAHKWTFEAPAGIKNNASFPILEFHSDNGSEFINSAAGERNRYSDLALLLGNTD